ncbi:hypothetical protein CIB48_g4779 [Xylaria polymorpha]|nr:hypothetical protein CIB48_g4779 [Xylaria polymorpha]
MESYHDFHDELWDLWYKGIGYLPPLDKSTIELLFEQGMLGDPDDRINPADIHEFQKGLGERNVSLEPSTDPALPDIKKLTSMAAQETQEERARHNQTWKLDLERSQNDPEDPVFQHTIMMSMIDRHRFIYTSGTDKQRVFDFAVERLWTCPPMPTRAPSRPSPVKKFLTQPKPDLAVAFRRDYLFPEHWKILPRALRNIICYEGRWVTKTTRAFHFMTVEGTSSNETAEEEVAFAQCLNNASQSLHNLYEFFREAGEEHVDVFFRQVRFFSAVSTTQGIRIRVHRACRASLHRACRAGGRLSCRACGHCECPECGQLAFRACGHRACLACGYLRENTEPDSRGLYEVAEMDPIVADYPLHFEYDDYFRADGAEFTRDNVVATFEQILLGYGIQVLLECLQKAADAVVEKCRKYVEEHGEQLPRANEFYSHGQMPPVIEELNSIPKRRRHNL